MEGRRPTLSRWSYLETLDLGVLLAEVGLKGRQRHTTTRLCAEQGKSEKGGEAVP
jgi:hypothetical protein